MTILSPGEEAFGMEEYQGGRSAVVRSERIYGGVIGNNAPLALSSAFKLVPYVGTFSICHGTARQNYGGKQTDD